ncbi:Xanthine phosphoribosyltransferase 1 [Ceratobasidium sp. 394]|nr:Xanthine phosphoribosyltransferase 1 [Ceratobasidium sp. 394]
MPSPAAYSLLPASSSGLTETHDEEIDLDEAWSLQRSPSHGWIPRTFVPFAFAARPSRLSRMVTRPSAVTVAALAALCTLALLTALSGYPVMPEWITGKHPTLRECFELPAEELMWQTTRLPTERTPSCPFDPESFTILDEASPSPKHKSSNDLQWPSECLEDMLARGKDRARSCDSVRSSLERQHIDLVWTWVNGSSPLLEITRGDRAAEISGVANKGETMAGLAAKLFRDHDELRHSVRAALKHFIHDASSFFLVGSDLPVSVRGADGDPTREARVGQLPSWLALEDMGVDGTFTNWGRTGKQTQFRINHHRDIFSDYRGTVFNSLAIESQFSNLRRIGVSDIFIYINDDVFFTRDLNARDFYMGEHGIVMRMQNYITISPNPDIPQHDGLEWESLRYSNWLLSNRFGSRHRPYPTHLAKSLSIPMLQEVADAWPNEIALAASRPFRGMKHMRGGETTADAYMVFLEHHWVVERWREALLWSWVVARGCDRVRYGEDLDVWTREVAEIAWKELGGSTGQMTLEVRRGHRSTLDDTHEWAGAQATSPDSEPSTTTLVLPISAKWQDADFRLSSVLKATSPDRENVRNAVLRMLQRYRFVIGETLFMFSIITDPHSAEQNVRAIQSDASLAIVCVNDNVAEGDEQVREIIGKWMDGRWNESASWERKE